MSRTTVLPRITDSAARARLRATIARAAQTGDRTRADEARRDLRAATLADHIRGVVDALPPLTTEQRGQLAALLRPTVADGGGSGA